MLGLLIVFSSKHYSKGVLLSTAFISLICGFIIELFTGVVF